MQYNEILKKIEQDVQNDSRTDLYRYNGLLEAIRFFSNRLTLDQITDAAFDFVNELLTVEKSAMYLFENNRFELKKQRGVKVENNYIVMTPELSNFVVFVGSVVSGRTTLEQYFDASILDTLEATVMLPLALENKLYGFFLLSRRITADFNENDILVCETLMNLFTNSLENCNRLERLQISNQELDEKIFNLFAINQSAKAMLTEHDLNELYSLAVDVFSELTQSAHTGFILYNDSSEKYILRAFRNVYNSSAKMEQISVSYNVKMIPDNQILDLSDTRSKELFCRMFDNGDELLSYLQAKYVVFVFGENRKILGFVTLGETVTGNRYKKSAFELVDSLASYTYIALSNAMLIGKVNDQKRLLQEKLDRMITLNRISKNINSALDSETLIDLTLETLTVSFGVQNAMIALYDEDTDSLKVCKATDLSMLDSVINMNPELEPLRRGSTVFEPSSEDLDKLIGEENAAAVGETSGALIIPMTLERYETVFIGAIIIMKLSVGILSDEENTLVFETIANHMSPLIAGFKNLEKQQNLLKPDTAKIFINNLEYQIEECRQYDFALEIIRITDENATPYEVSEVPNILANITENVYPVTHNRTEIIVTHDFEYNFNLVKNSLSDINITIDRLQFNKDFTDMDSFLALK
ncbi:MAG: GAF domain-containing protein [Acetivibrionales bacterium]|jgi:transcriptional regulator with GAF, ATPase, and Fis domain